MDNNKFEETTEPPHTVSSGRTKLNALAIQLTFRKIELKIANSELGFDEIH